MQVIYFAWVRQKIGLAEESVAPPPEVRDVGQLMHWLGGRSAGHAAAFADPRQVRAAVNEVFCGPDHPVAPDDEVAFFPPVTGG